MTRVLLRPEARTDALDAFGYYEQRRPGLGVEFREALDSAFARIVETPFAHPIVHRDVHRALVTRFPYAVFYRVAPDSVIIIAILHGRMHPRRVRHRR